MITKIRGIYGYLSTEHACQAFKDCVLFSVLFHYSSTNLDFFILLVVFVGQMLSKDKLLLSSLSATCCEPRHILLLLLLQSLRGSVIEK